LLDRTQRQSEQFRAQFIGKQAELLLEEKVRMPFGLCWRGHTKRYVEGYILCGDGSGVQMEEGQLISGVFTGSAANAQGLMFAPLVESGGKIRYDKEM
jgi:hypothetical protein